MRAETIDRVRSSFQSRWLQPGWPAPEVAENVNRDELGNLGLTTSEVEDLVAFLNTLTDGWQGP